MLRNACRAENADFLLDLLKQGFNPADQKDHGSSLIHTCIQHLQWTLDYNWFTQDRDKDIDSHRSRETLKMIHVLAKSGAKWMPAERYEINDARRSFLKMSDDYIVEFVWIMAQYDGCSRENIEQLLRTPTIRRHVVKHQSRIEELLKDFHH